MNYQAKRAVVTVGTGRGFVVKFQRRKAVDRVVITAAHCLPSFPACMSFSHPEERKYENLIGPLGEKPSICAECLFVDPIGDIAVLGSPDTQDMSE
jgi:hypothetical protein